jgi:molecular chaperone HscA
VDEGGSLLLPSVVHYAPDGSVIVGARARVLAAAEPTSTIASVKRFMGKGPEDAETKALGAYRFATGGSVVRFEVKGGPPVTPIEVSAEILRTLKRRAEPRSPARWSRRSSPCRPTSTTPSGRPPATPGGWRGSRCCGC